MKSHEPSDLMEEQGSYGECFQRFKLNIGRSIDSSQQEPLDFLRISISGFHGLMFQNLCIKTRKVRSPRKAESLVMGPTLGIMSRVDISGFREIENRDFGVRGAELHDIATHELTIRRNPKLAKERSLDLPRISISGFRGLKSRNLCIKNREVRSHKKAKSLVLGPTLRIVSSVDISGFREIENRDFGVHGVELHDIATHELTIRRNLKSARERSSVDYFRVSRI
jgi:hypothetical protein